MSATLQITVDAHDPRTLSLFWKEVLGYVHPGPPGVDLAPGADPLAAWDAFLEAHDVPEELRNSASALEDPDGTGPRIFFQQVPEDKVAKNRVHLDVRTASRLERHDPEVPTSVGFLVMGDPEGNEFCLD